jgi:hypothetical protein
MSQVVPPPGEQIHFERKGSGVPIAGFVFGLVGTLIGLIPVLFWLTIPLGLMGMLLGGVGWRRAVHTPDSGAKRLSIAGTILGAIAIVLALVASVIIDDAI